MFSCQNVQQCIIPPPLYIQECAICWELRRLIGPLEIGLSYIDNNSPTFLQ